jgi:protein subunit release factor A
MRDSCLQVLPLSEEPGSDRTDDLLKLEDLRVEVMRSRGAGGQVRLVFLRPVSA